MITIFVVGLIGIIFSGWFLHPEIIGGDWPYYYDAFLRGFTLPPDMWSPWLGNGLGGVNVLLGLSLFQSLLIVPFTQWLQIPWPVVYKAGWFGLFLILGGYSSWRLSKHILSPLIFLTNSYILMLVSGGQMGVALAYAIAPLILARFIEHTPLVGTACVLAFQIMVDIRIAYVTLLAVFVHLVLTKKHFVSGLLVIIAAVFLNAFWLLPQFLLKTNPIEALGAAYSSVDSLKFFSFADFSHALSLLHPNWPENIFGKTYFLQPEFLFLPVIAFLSLFLKKNRTVLLFSILALLGAFFGKGANPPFGSVYIWLFEHVPGFVMFRDPTKWYLLVVLSYTVLLPFGLSKINKKFGTASCVLFVVFWVVLHRQAFLGKLPGTFVLRSVPPVYESYKTFIADQPDFFRTLWVPRQSRFAYTTPLHPATEAEPLFGATDSATLSRALADSVTKSRLAVLGIKYVVVPHDPLGEIFVSDRKYDEGKRRSYIHALDAVLWLRKVRDDELTIYETPSFKSLFWSDEGPVSYVRKSYGLYEVTLDHNGAIHFSQSYHPGWKGAQKAEYGLMAFDAPKGARTLLVAFGPETYVRWGVSITILTLVVLIAISFYNTWHRTV